MLRVADAGSSVEWYARLGFRLEWTHRFEPDFPVFASISREGGCRIFLSEHLGDANPGMLIHLRIAEFERAALDFDVAVRQQPWGPEVHLRDPDGNRVIVGPMQQVTS